MSLDQMQAAFGFNDPVDFLRAVLGRRLLPDQAARVIVTEHLGSYMLGNDEHQMHQRSESGPPLKLAEKPNSTPMTR